MEFEIIDLSSDTPSMFKVEIEITKTRERKYFCFPKGDGWEDEIDGKPRFIDNIQHRIKVEEDNKLISIENVKQRMKGKKFTAMKTEKEKSDNSAEPTEE